MISVYVECSPDYIVTTSLACPCCCQCFLFYFRMPLLYSSHRSGRIKCRVLKYKSVLSILLCRSCLIIISCMEGCMVKLEKIDRSIVWPEDSPQAQSKGIRGQYQTGSDIWERMLGNEGDQQEKDCYHGDEDASRDPRSVQTRPHAKRGYPTRLCAVAVFVGLDMSRDEMRTTSPAEWWTWPNLVPDDEDAPRRRGPNNWRTTWRPWVLPRTWP